MKNRLSLGGLGVGLGLAAFALSACGGKEVGLGGQGASDGGTGGSSGGEGGAGGGGSGDGGNSTETYPGGPAWPGGPQLPAVTGSARSSKLDVLLVVDNSSSMADKQAVFRATVGDMIAKLTAEGSGVDDLHVGVITSSLGGLGSSTCEPRANATELRVEMENDRAHLVGARPRAAGAGVTSDFAQWTRSGSASNVAGQVEAMVSVAGEFGCGFESTLEAAYRFLADPEPPEEVVLAPCESSPAAQCATRSGTDTELLAQRAAFLRPDSAVAIVVLSDENDCSTQDEGQFYFSRRQEITLGASSACAANPNDPCCYSCLQAPPAGCQADPICNAPNPDLDPPNLRCFEQKRRFGIDFLQPVERYVNAFTKPWLCTSRADLSVADCDEPILVRADIVPEGYEPSYAKNPLFQSDAGNRGRSMVYFMGILGVPAGEVSATGTVSWERVLGNTNPDEGLPVPPTNALMVESIYPRGGSGVDGETLQPPTAGYLANSENGHEYASVRGEDLQYACIFPLLQPRDCLDFDRPPPTPGQPLTDLPFCDCDEVAVGDMNPLCQAPDGSYSRVQGFAKAYPSLRHLEVTKGMGENGAVGSICARNLTDPSQPDYGYRQSVDALLERVSRSVE